MSNVKVAVRVRPLSQREADKSARSIVEVTGDTISVTNVKVDHFSEYADSRERVKHFSFDFCYDSSIPPQRPDYASQQLVFQDLGTEVLQAAFEGYNACVFAYGQTSTGKTYTMMGSTEELGLIPRICEGLFSHVDDFVGDHVSFRLDVSYFEIYNERVRDLLRPTIMRGNDNYTLKVREHPKDGPYVQDLSSHCVKDNQGIQELIDRGNENRTTAATYMHDHSSRSHAIFTINFTQAKLEDDLPHEIVSKIHLVDLAGSERADPNYSANYKGRLKEGSNINKSLVTLGNVIKTLAERSLLTWSTDTLGSTQSFQSSPGDPNYSPKRTRLPYIPYRDSVLTWLLKDSLGGNSKTIMISTITPASIYYNETISTLRYAQRAKSIINKPKINEDPNVTLIRELRREIGSLRELLKTAQMASSQMSGIDLLDYSAVMVQTEQGVNTAEGSTLAAQLHDTEVMANKLTQTWMDKWLEAHDIMKESDLSIRDLKHRANSMGVMIESQMPHLIGMDNDILSTGVTIYHLKEGKTLVGREDAQRQQDIVLSGPSVQREHCFIKNHYGTVTLHPNRGAQITVNGLECKTPIRLKQGDYLLLGKTNMFRFNNPEEAARLRQRRESGADSSEDLLSRSSSTDSFDKSDSDSISTSGIHPFHPLYGPNLQLERQYQNESERINQAKRELEMLRDQHAKAEEAIKEKEEEIWRTHEEHRAEIEEEKQKVRQMMEEVEKQKQQAESELEYAWECLNKEKEAFNKQLEKELTTLKQKDQNNLTTQTEKMEAELPTIDLSDRPIVEIVQTHQQTLKGRMKQLVQQELIGTLHHKETEESLRKQSEDVEDYFQQSQEEIQKRLGKLKEVETEYKSEDAEHFKEIHNKKSDMEEIGKREEQLQLYLEEKRDLLLVGSQLPQPLRTACSEEVLTGDQVQDVGFPVRTTSLRALPRGSEGDLPSMSHRLSTLHCDKSRDSALNDSVESMDYSITSSAGEEGSKKTKPKVSTTAKNVTDRLYKAPEPKFKYEPKARSPKPVGASKFDRGGASKIDHGDKKRKSDSKEFDDDKKRPFNRKKGDGDGELGPSNKKNRENIRQVVSSRSSPVRTVSPVTKVSKKGASVKSSSTVCDKTKPFPPKSKMGDQTLPLSKSSPNLRDRSSSPKVRIMVPKATNRNMSPNAPQSPDKELLALPERTASPIMTSGRSRRLSPTQSLSPEPGGNSSGRIFVPRLRHVTSATSLVSVPEAIAEEVEPTEQNMKHSELNVPLVVVKRRKKRHTDTDEFRRHSAPMGEELADAFEQYTHEIEDSLEKERCEMINNENLSNNISFSINDTTTGLNEDKHNIPMDVDTHGMRQVKDESVTLHVGIAGTLMLTDLDSIGCAEGVTVQQEECDGDEVVNIDNTDRIMVCSTSSAVSDTLSVESNASDASTVIDTVFNETSDNVIKGVNTDGTSSVCPGDVSMETNVKAGSKRESSLRDDDHIKAANIDKSNDDQIVDSALLDEESSAISDHVDCSGQSSRKKNKIKVYLSPRNTCRDDSADLRNREYYSSDSLDDGEHSVDSLDKSKSPQERIQEAEDLSDSLEGSDSDVVKRDTLKSQDTVHKLEDGDFADIHMSMEVSASEQSSSQSAVQKFCNDELAACMDVSASEICSPGLQTSTEALGRTDDEQTVDNMTLRTDKNEFLPNKSDLSGDKSIVGETEEPENLDKTCNDINPTSMTIPRDNGHSQLIVANDSPGQSCKKSETVVVKAPKKKPETRTLGVSTSPELMPPELLEGCHDDGISQASQDSLQEVTEQLMELEEALQKESQETQRGVGLSNTPISTARKAARQRAMIRQTQRGGSGESDATDHISDDAHANGGPVKTSSRPSSASRRRRRTQLKPADRKCKRHRGPSSEDYNSTDSEGIRSNNSLTDEDNDISKPSLPGDDVVLRTSDVGRHSLEPSRDAELSASGGDGTVSEDIEESELDQYCAELQRRDEYDNIDTEENLSEKPINMEGSSRPKRLNRYVLPDSESTRDSNSRDGYQKKQRLDTWSVDSQYESQDERPSSRTHSETRDTGQQTDVSSVDSPLLSPFSPFASFRSPSSTSTQTESPRLRLNMTISPVSVWDSGEREIKSPRKCSTSGGLTTHHEKNITKCKSKSKSVNLQMAATDVWSAEFYIPNQSASEASPLNHGDSSESEDDGSYSMETESLAPQTPSSSDKFIEHGRFVFDDAQPGRAVPLKYEVTIREEATNVTYNVDTTEYRTYGLSSPVNTNYPDTININLSETTANSSENYTERVTSDHKNYQAANAFTPSGNSAIISERNFGRVHDMSLSDSGTDREQSMDREVVSNEHSHAVDTGGAKSTPLHHTCPENAELLKADYMHSPRESDTTSDYGTMIGDGRRCNTSFLSDSGSEADLHAADKGHDLNQTLSADDADPKDIDYPPLHFRVGEQNISQLNEEGAFSLPPVGQDVCASDRVRRKRGVAPTSSALSRTAVIVSNVIGDNGRQSPLDQLVDLIVVGDVDNVDDTSQQPLNVTESADSSERFHSLSDSSHFETPQDSPRNLNDKAVNEEDRQEPVQENELFSIKLPDLKTVSVNTDEPSIVKEKPFERQEDNSLREIRKRELQQKIARLKDSRSDSAISSDYTDADSTSPRSSRLYDSDKTSRSGAIGNLLRDLPVEGANIEVMTTQTETQFNSNEASSVSSPVKSLDIDNKSAKKSPFKDSGNVCDDDVTGSETEGSPKVGHFDPESDELEDNNAMLDEIHKMESFESETTNEEESRSERSLSPGEVMLEYVFGDKMKASRESSREDDPMKDVEENENRILKEKSPSLSDLQLQKDKKDFRRSMSENCIDQYDEVSQSDTEGNNTSSNDSIVFVFMGNSHSKDSMEQLKSFTSRQPGYKVDLESSQELLEDDDEQNRGNSDRNGTIHDSMETVETIKDSVQSNETPCNEDAQPVDNDYEIDDKPLRHKFGIDESILPIPTKSVSFDNLPKQSFVEKPVHKSRSASMLDVAQIEMDKVDDSKNNEGIFPPCFESSEGGSHDTNAHERRFNSFGSNNLTDSSVEEATILPINSHNQVTYSTIPLGISPTEENNTFISENLSKSDFNRYHAPILVERGMVTSNEDLSDKAENVFSKKMGIEVSTQTYADIDDQKMSKGHVLPSLDSPFRARSIGDVSQPVRGTELALSEETDNWYNLSNIVKETNNMIQSIQGGGTTRASSTQAHHNHIDNEAPDAYSSSPRSTTTQDDVTQTGSSLVDLHSSECQTELNDSSRILETSSDGTQTDTTCLQMGEVETTDILPSDGEDGLKSPVGQQPIQSKMSVQTETSQTVDSRPSEDGNYTEYHREHQERKRRSSDNETVVVEREYVYETQFEYPDLEASNAEMEALKSQHEKMMESIRKAADDRKSRSEKLRNKIQHQSNVVYNVDARNRYKTFENDDVDSKYDEQKYETETRSRDHRESLNESREEHSDIVITRKSGANTKENNASDRLDTREQVIKGDTSRMCEQDTRNHEQSGQKYSKVSTSHQYDKKEIISKEVSEDAFPKCDRYKYIYVDTIIQSSDSDEEIPKADNSHDNVKQEVITNKSNSGAKDSFDGTEEGIINQKMINHNFEAAEPDIQTRSCNENERSQEEARLENYVNEDFVVLEQKLQKNETIWNETNPPKGRHRNNEPIISAQNGVLPSSSCLVPKESLVMPTGATRTDLPQNKDIGFDTIGAKLMSIPLRREVEKDVVEDVLSDSELLKTPPNSPTLERMVSEGVRRDSSPVDRESVSEPRYHPDRRDVTPMETSVFGLGGGRMPHRTAVSTGVDAHVDISDDFTQTDSSLERVVSEGVRRGSGPVDRESVSEPRYHPDRRDMTSMETNGFGIGGGRIPHRTAVSTGVDAHVDISDDFTQTDLSLDLSKLENGDLHNTDRYNKLENRSIKNELDRLQKERVQIIDLLSLNFLPASLTVELLEAKLNYCIGQTDLLLQALDESWDDYNIVVRENSHTHVTKEYLTKYKYDLQQSKSDIEICKERMDRKQGTGRGRPKGRNRDIMRMRRQAEVEAFKSERMREQTTYERLKHSHHSSDSRSSRSISPVSSSHSPRHMTPNQHKEYLLQLRKKIVNQTLTEQYMQDRLSRSCSPQIYRQDQRSHPRSTDHIAARRQCRSPDTHLSYSPRIAFSATDELPADVDYGISTYLVPPQHGGGYRSYSNQRPPSSTLLSPTNFTSYTSESLSPRGRSLSPSYMNERLAMSRPAYAHEESRKLLQEMEKTREQNQREISRAHHTLHTYKRSSDSVTSERPSHSSYSDYASDLLRSSIQGEVSGSYELYDDEVSQLTSTRPLSPTSSAMSTNREFIPDSRYSGSFNPYKIRPVRSSDIKSRLHWLRHRAKKET